MGGGGVKGRTNAHKLEAEESIINPRVAEFGPDVTHCHARQRQVRLHVADLHHERVRAVVLKLPTHPLEWLPNNCKRLTVPTHIPFNGCHTLEPPKNPLETSP